MFKSYSRIIQEASRRPDADDIIKSYPSFLLLFLVLGVPISRANTQRVRKATDLLASYQT